MKSRALGKKKPSLLGPIIGVAVLAALSGCNGGSSSSSSSSSSSPSTSTALFLYGFMPGASDYSVQGYSVDTTTGALTQVVASTATTVPTGVCNTNGCANGGMTYYPDSVLYMWNDAASANGNMYPFAADPNTGALTAGPTFSYPGSIGSYQNTCGSQGMYPEQGYASNILDLSTTNNNCTAGATTVTASPYTVGTAGALATLSGSGSITSAVTAGVLTTNTFSLGISLGTSYGSATGYAIGPNGGIGSATGTTTFTGSAIGLASEGTGSSRLTFVLSTDGTTGFYAYPLTNTGVGALSGSTTNFGGLSCSSNVQVVSNPSGNGVAISCLTATTNIYEIQEFGISGSGVLMAGSETPVSVVTGGGNARVRFDNSGAYMFIDVPGSPDTTKEYPISSAGDAILAQIGPTLTGRMFGTPTGEFGFLVTGNSASTTITPEQINASNGALTAGAAVTMAADNASGTRDIFLFGGSAAQGYVPLNNNN